MKKFKITYRDFDPTCPNFTQIVEAYDREHAIEVFFDSDPDDDWKIISVRLVK